MASLRVAFVSAMSGSAWGGSEVLWSNAALELAQEGHEILASVVRWPEVPAPLCRLADKGGLIDRRSFRSPSRWERLFARLKLRRNVHFGWEPSWHTIVKFRPDVVCISHGAFACGIDWMKRCLDAKIPYVSVAQANSEHWWPNDSDVSLIRDCYVGSEKAYFVSHANLRLFELQIGQTLDNAEVIWNPYNVPFDAEATWPAEANGYRLACVARLEPTAKGQDILCQVMALGKWRERNVTLTLFGKGDWENSLRQLVAMLRIESQVLFGGHVTDITSLWANHHALILPSRYEGLPLSLVEALLCGRTAVVTNVAGNTEVVEDNITGFVAASPTIASVDEAMERAWKRRDEWQPIGALAYDAIRQQVPRNPSRLFAEKLVNMAAEIN